MFRRDVDGCTLSVQGRTFIVNLLYFVMCCSSLNCVIVSDESSSSSFVNVYLFVCRSVSAAAAVAFNSGMLSLQLPVKRVILALSSYQVMLPPLILARLFPELTVTQIISTAITNIRNLLYCEG